jgi:hypothetical protein
MDRCMENKSVSGVQASKVFICLGKPPLEHLQFIYSFLDV